jgi:hypothetical protein
MRSRGLSADRERVRAVVVVEVLDAAALISPAYDDGTATAQSISERWLAHHTALRARAHAQ